MKLLLVSPPFLVPSAPPLGIASLVAALREARPNHDVAVEDWNLDFFRRWMLSNPAHLCTAHPDHLLGMVCPALLTDDGQGEALWRTLSTLPSGPAGADAYMTACREMDAWYGAMATFVRAIVEPWIEGRRDLPDGVLDGLFGGALTRLSADPPDLLGLSVLTEQQLPLALAAARAAKERCGVPVALGGAMMAHLEPAEVLATCPYVDYVFWGEGEQTVVDFVDAWQDAAALERVAGLGHRDADGGPCCHPDPPAPSLASLPSPDFSGFTLSEYLTPEPVLPMLTSRGCYWGKCTFCSHTRPYAPGVRIRSAERVADEMAGYVERYGVRNFLLVDEAIAPKTLDGLSVELRERSLDVRFGAEGVRVEESFDAARLTAAYASGLRWVYVGVESASAKILDRIDKGIDPGRVERFIEACLQAGITPELSFIVGIPGTTSEDLDVEADFLRRHAVDSGSFVLLAGSPLARDPAAHGLRVEGREVLYRSGGAVLHAPRFRFTTSVGLSPMQADLELQAALGPHRRRMRPHLGEVHAVLLADTDYFTSEERPPEPAPPEHRALSVLEKDPHQDTAWAIHAAGCLEAQGALSEAWDVLARCGADDPSGAVTLHRMGLLVAAGQPEEALALATPAALGSDAGPAIHNQLARACALLGNSPGVIEHGREAHRAAYEPQGLQWLLAQAYEEQGDLQAATTAYQAAEEEDPRTPDIDEAAARCFRALKKNRRARQLEERASRKRREGRA